MTYQLPPSYQLKEGLEDFTNYNFFFEGSFRYAVEVRHPSWFNELAYNFFKNNNVTMVWSQMNRLQTPPIVTSDFVYLRLIGERSIRPHFLPTMRIVSFMKITIPVFLPAYLLLLQ